MASFSAIPKAQPQSPSPIPSPATKRYAFTPKHTAKIPRAWERKPSTPFAPRNESQKIWKRYQFPDVTVAGTFAAGIGQSKDVETRALKKARLEGDETTACITSWDEELHETKHKQSMHQDRGPAITSSVAHPTTISHGVETLSPTRDLATLPNPGQDVERQETANDVPADQGEKPSVVETVGGSYKEFQGRDAVAAAVERLSPHDETTTESPDSEDEEDPGEHSFPKELAGFERAVSTHAELSAVDEEATGSLDSGTASEEDHIPARLSPPKCTTNDGQIGPKESADEAAAVHLNNTLGGNSEDDKDIQQRQKVTDISKQPILSRTQTTPDVTTNAEQDGAPGDNTHDVLVLQSEDRDHAHHHGTPQQQETVFKPISHDEVVRQSPNKAPMSACDPELIYVMPPVGLEVSATDSEDTGNGQVGSPLSQNIPTHARDETSRPPDVIQDEDTDYLHAFLTRAKAKRAAREASPSKVERISHSPMTRSRAALFPLSTNSASPQKTTTSTTIKQEVHTNYGSEGLGVNREGSPCRRSGRTRANRVGKPPKVTPSTIPVRRSNGTEFIFLQGKDTAQVALATRTNTKRNKGEAVMPKIKLQALSQVQQSPSKSPKVRKGKEVSWKDEPTYFGVDAEDVEGPGEEQKDEDKPRTRKLRRLGAAHGTPAPNKTTAGDELYVRSAVSRKRGKVK